ncbi:MAG: TIGR03009 domain-containing protein [Gemmataceae bacterium]|nr:TIGR03009 domain-containing protein [Gemmataceae bacterium]
MRPAVLVTLAALLTAGAMAAAQQPGTPGGAPVPGQPLPPGAQPAVQPPQPKADPQLDQHLAGWEKKMAGVANMRTEIALKRTDFTTKKETNYTGVVLCLKPTLAVMRLENAGDKTKVDYEAYISDGKGFYVYNGLAKTVTKFKMPQNGVGVDNLMLDFVSGMKAKDVKERFDISLFKSDEHYIYLDIKPLLAKDQREFKHIRMALFGPGAATSKFAYLPAQVFLLKPNGDTEEWRFGGKDGPQVDIPGVEPKLFQYVEIPGWKVQEAPEAAPNGAGGARPAGGVPPPNPDTRVRPNPIPPTVPVIPKKQ